MVKFSEKDRGKQFVSVHIPSDTSPRFLFDQLRDDYLEVEEELMQYKDEELVIEVPSCGLGFSMNNLRSFLRHRCDFPDAQLTMFSVDPDEPSQRWYGK